MALRKSLFATEETPAASSNAASGGATRKPLFYGVEEKKPAASVPVVPVVSKTEIAAPAGAAAQGGARIGADPTKVTIAPQMAKPYVMPTSIKLLTAAVPPLGFLANTIASAKHTIENPEYDAQGNVKGFLPNVAKYAPAGVENLKIQAGGALKGVGALIEKGIENNKSKDVYAGNSRLKKMQDDSNRIVLAAFEDSGNWLRANAEKKLAENPRLADPTYFYKEEIVNGVKQKVRRDNDFEILKEHPQEYFAHALATNAPSLAASLALLAAGAGTAVSGYYFANTVGERVDDAEKAGVSRKDVMNKAIVEGIVVAALERVGLEGLLGKALPKGSAQVVANNFKKNLVNYLGKVGVGLTAEGTTEGLQQVASNVVEKTYRENKKILEGVSASFLQGALSGAPFSAFNSVNLQNDNAPESQEPQVRLPNVPVKTLENYLSLRGAPVDPNGNQQDALAIQINRLRSNLDTAFNDNKETAVSVTSKEGAAPVLSIEVAPMDDGKWAYSYNINTPEKGYVADFKNNEPAATREEAIARAKQEVSQYVQDNSDSVSDSAAADFQHISDELTSGKEPTPVYEGGDGERVNANQLTKAGNMVRVKTPDGDIDVQTEHPEVLSQFAKDRESVNFKIVDSLGKNTDGTDVTAKFSWDFKTKQATVEVTETAKALQLLREIGVKIDASTTKTLNENLSKHFPNYAGQRKQFNQMIADYALAKLKGNATNEQLNAEMVRVSENMKQEIAKISAAELRKTQNQSFVKQISEITDSPEGRAEAPELARVLDFADGKDVFDLKAITGNQAKAAAFNELEKTKKAQLKEAEQSPEIEQVILREEARKAELVARQEGRNLSAFMDWKRILRAIRNSSDFRKEGGVSDKTAVGTIMQKGNIVVLVPRENVKKYAAKGYVAAATMDEVINVSGFDTAQDYIEFITELDKDLRSVVNTSVRKTAHEYLLKNDPNYANLEATINRLRDELVQEAEAISSAQPAAKAADARVPVQAEKRASEVESPTVRDSRTVEKTNELKLMAQAAKSPEDFLMMLKSDKDFSFHQTGEISAKAIYENGFTTGVENGLGEKRPSVYSFPAKNSYGKIIYIREGGNGVEIPLNISGLKIEDRTSVQYSDEQLADEVHVIIPEGMDGVLVRYGAGKNELVLTKNAANSARFDYKEFYAKAKATPKPAEKAPTIAPEKPKAPDQTITQRFSKVGRSIQEKAIEQGLISTYGDTAGYNPITIKDQAARAAEIMRTDIEKAKRIVLGEDPLPPGVLAGTMIKAMEDYALKTKDPQLALDIANSPLTAETSIHAQEMRILAERNPDSAVANIQRAQKLKEQAAKERGLKKETVVEEIRKDVEKSYKKKQTKESWGSFIDSITC